MPDYSRLRSLTARQLTRALLRDGFSLTRQTGSHQRYRHPDGRRVTVPFHKGSATFLPKTLRTIIEAQARWTEHDLKRLGLLLGSNLLSLQNSSLAAQLRALSRLPDVFRVALSRD